MAGQRQREPIGHTDEDVRARHDLLDAIKPHQRLADMEICQRRDGEREIGRPARLRAIGGDRQAHRRLDMARIAGGRRTGADHGEGAGQQGATSGETRHRTNRPGLDLGTAGEPRRAQVPMRYAPNVVTFPR
jgi:hypothetical protein